jgi:hypothetical protein
MPRPTSVGSASACEARFEPHSMPGPCHWCGPPRCSPATGRGVAAPPAATRSVSARWSTSSPTAMAAPSICTSGAPDCGTRSFGDVVWRISPEHVIAPVPGRRLAVASAQPSPPCSSTPTRRSCGSSIGGWTPAPPASGSSSSGWRTRGFTSASVSTALGAGSPCSTGAAAATSWSLRPGRRTSRWRGVPCSGRRGRLRKQEPCRGALLWLLERLPFPTTTIISRDPSASMSVRSPEYPLLLIKPELRQRPACRGFGTTIRRGGDEASRILQSRTQ